MVFLDSLVQDMNRNKTGLDEVNMRKVNPSRLGPNEIRGAIAEQLVRQWIQKCPETDFFADLPLKVNGYEARHMPSGIVIFEGSITKLEYDFVVKYHMPLP
ncbi:hypothetical protein COY27_02710 [Candidatus Woesearchaeota archaeon CG_4_10_14_0_2_um_filter_33_13]|nr:MAG: hypothetical protein COY27_02710 [Candidatus Woesearchaeota archaeon CG_4_10_14_0_2_um_filter_33_13]